MKLDILLVINKVPYNYIALFGYVFPQSDFFTPIDHHLVHIHYFLLPFLGD